MSTSDNVRELEQLIDGQLPWDRVQEIIKSPKDGERFQKTLEIYQGRVSFKERILLPLTPSLFIVDKSSEYIVMCKCGQEFGDYRINWKLHSHVSVRNTLEDFEKIYPGVQRPDPEYCEIREYYCPRCGTQLEVESLTPGMPVDFEFLPDLDTFYSKWLKTPLPKSVEFVDKTNDVIGEWVKEIEG